MPPFVVFNLTGKTKNQTKQTCNLPLDLNDKLAGISGEFLPVCNETLAKHILSVILPSPRQCRLSSRACTRSACVSRQVTLTQTQKTLLKLLLLPLHQENCPIWHESRLRGRVEAPRRSRLRRALKATRCEKTISQQNILSKVFERNLSFLPPLGVKSGLDEAAAADVFWTFLECFINVRLEERESK